MENEVEIKVTKEKKVGDKSPKLEVLEGEGEGERGREREREGERERGRELVDI